MRKNCIFESCVNIACDMFVFSLYANKKTQAYINLFHSLRIGLNETNTDYRSTEILGTAFVVHFGKSKFGDVLYFSDPYDSRKLFSVLFLSEAQKKIRRVDQDTASVVFTIYPLALQKNEAWLSFFILCCESGNINRVDVCFDFVLPIAKILKTFITKRKAKNQFTSPDGSIETQYMGRLERVKNRRHLLRVYDKNKDTLSKNKIEQYGHYLKFANVTRVEFEVRAQTLRSFPLDPFRLGDPEYLFSYCKSLLSGYSIKWHTEKQILFPQIQKRQEEIQTTGKVDYFAPRLLSVAKKCFDCGWNKKEIIDYLSSNL